MGRVTRSTHPQIVQPPHNLNPALSKPGTPCPAQQATTEHSNDLLTPLSALDLEGLPSHGSQMTRVQNPHTAFNTVSSSASDHFLNGQDVSQHIANTVQGALASDIRLSNCAFEIQVHIHDHQTSGSKKLGDEALASLKRKRAESEMSTRLEVEEEQDERAAKKPKLSLGNVENVGKTCPWRVAVKRRRSERMLRGGRRISWAL